MPSFLGTLLNQTNADRKTTVHRIAIATNLLFIAWMPTVNFAVQCELLSVAPSYTVSIVGGRARNTAVPYLRGFPPSSKMQCSIIANAPQARSNENSN